MDLHALKALAKARKEVWHPVGSFEFRIKRMSLLDLHKIDAAATEHKQVGDKIHSEVNVPKRIALEFDAVTGWKGVKVKHLVQGHDEPDEDVPFDRELLDVLSANFPVVRPGIEAALYTGAMAFQAELEAAEKN